MPELAPEPLTPEPQLISEKIGLPTRTPFGGKYVKKLESKSVAAVPCPCGPPLGPLGRPRSVARRGFAQLGITKTKATAPVVIEAFVPLDGSDIIVEGLDFMVRAPAPPGKCPGDKAGPCERWAA